MGKSISALEELRKKNKEIERLKNEALDLANEAFEEFSKGIFDRYDRIESFAWNQYTPYFNDGDSCVFSANTDYIKINEEYAEECEWFSEKNILSYGTFDRESKTYVGRVEEENKLYDPELCAAAKEIQQFLGSMTDDFFIKRFGDHSEITVTRQGVEVDEYDHD